MGVGWVKRYCEKLCEFYSKLGLKTVVVRPTNVYGKYDKKDPAKCHVIPAMIMRALRKENPFKIYGDGLAVKDLIHVDDFVNILVRVAFNYDTSDPINIASYHTYTINEIAEKICKAVGYEPKFEHIETNMEQIPARLIDRFKLNCIIGLPQFLTLEEGLERTIPWFS
jgi:GDP-L-fucose synthase